MQILLKAPPVSLGNLNDHEALELIQSFGQRLSQPKDEITQACNLASGPADLAIILERPHRRQKYCFSFEQFVTNCSTLKVVDNLIRFATKGTRSIHTVTIPDAFSFKPIKGQPQPSADECHELITQMLRVKKPQVLLCCWNGECTNSWVDQFRSRGVGWLPIRSEGVIESQPTVIIRSFHPAKAIYYNKCNANYRILLVYHFVSAFAELDKPSPMPGWIEALGQQSQDDAR